MSDRSNEAAEAERKMPEADAKATVPKGNPVEPVKDFDLGKIDKDRRIFQNGDTDRGTDQD